MDVRGSSEKEASPKNFEGGGSQIAPLTDGAIA